MLKLQISTAIVEDGRNWVQTLFVQITIKVEHSQEQRILNDKTDLFCKLFSMDNSCKSWTNEGYKILEFVICFKYHRNQIQLVSVQIKFQSFYTKTTTKKLKSKENDVSFTK